jgi:TldD protein
MGSQDEGIVRNRRPAFLGESLMKTAVGIISLVLVLSAGARAQEEKAPDRALMKALEFELQRSVEKLKNAGEAPLYFLAYRVYDVEDVSISGSYGAVDGRQQGGRQRHLDVELRVGSPQLDNTHKVRAEGFDLSEMMMQFSGVQPFPFEDDEIAIRSALWAATDRHFKDAQRKYTKVKANKAVKVEEEDASDDFSVRKAVTHSSSGVSFKIDQKPWEDRVRKLSAVFKEYSFLQRSSVTFNATRTRRTCATSEGTRIQDERLQYRLFMTVQTVADDGMQLWLYEGWEVTTLADLPDDAKLEGTARALADQLGTLRTAPVAEPYAGPAILRSRAAGVFFHEIFGHRIEGHRQKDENEGRTFAKKIGQPIMPEFISVVDDPTRERLGRTPLNGHYQFDDEGVPAEKVTLVDKGVLKSFLMGRSPVKGFTDSNGHGRCSPGMPPCARQGNLMVESTKRVSFEKLRQMLIDEIKKQGKPHGLIFDDIAGGFTMTQSFMPQAFKLLPLRVWRVYSDGRPDEVLRGVDIVGTPLASLERILCAADDDDVFNGTCGAESGWVPVAAASPSLLVGTIEVERQQKAQDKPPLLPAPRHDPDDPKAAPRKESKP